jgi:hypothetical protein
MIWVLKHAHRRKFEYQVAFLKNSEELRFGNNLKISQQIFMMLLVGTRR